MLEPKTLKVLGWGTVALVIIVLVAILIWLPKWQAEQIITLSQTARFTAENEARRTLATIIGGMVILVGLDRSAAQSAFSEFLNDRSLTPQQIRFVEMVIDQLTARGVMDAEALYEAPFSNLHAGGPDALFGGKENVIEGIFDRLQTLDSGLRAETG